MAGRGRQSTLPAWMTEGGANADLSTMASTVSVNSVQQGQFDDSQKNESRERSNGHSGGDSRSRQPSSRDERPRKSRSRDRGHRSSRSNRSRYFKNLTKTDINFDDRKYLNVHKLTFFALLDREIVRGIEMSDRARRIEKRKDPPHQMVVEVVVAEKCGSHAKIQEYQILMCALLTALNFLELDWVVYQLVLDWEGIHHKQEGIMDMVSIAL